LLKNCSVTDLDLLAASKLDREWYVWALCHALVEPGTAAEAARRLHEADDALIQIFWEQFLFLANEGQRRAILGPLFPATDEGARLLVRSLKHLSWLPPDTLLWVLDSLGAFKKERIQFWITQDNLRLLLHALQRMGEASEPIWQRICSLFDSDVLLPGDSGQHALLLELWGAESQPGLRIPPSAAETLKDWMTLRERFEKASAVPASARQDLIDSCDRLHLDPILVLARYFEKYLAPNGMDEEALEDFVRFFHSFFLDGKGYQDYGARLIAWLRIVEKCQNEADQQHYQRYYLDRHIPAEYRWRLAQDMHGAGRLLDTVHQQLSKPTEIDLLGIPQAILFQLTGVRVSNSKSLGQRISSEDSSAKEPKSETLSSLMWLSPTVLAFVLAVGLCGAFQSYLGKTVMLVPFLPAVALLAEGLALHSTGLILGEMRGRQWTWRDLRGVLGRQMRPALFLGVICGLIGGAYGYFWDVPWNLAWRLGGAIFAGIAVAPIISLAVPLLSSRFRLAMWLPYGILARASAGILALLIYLGLAYVLIS
jgi:hypothetical protein